MCRLLLMTIACLSILFGISGLWMLPKLVQQKIEQRIQLKIGTETFERFTKVPIPLTVKFYLFNVTNSEQVLLGLERPKFQEVGPFMFKQWRRREIVDFEDNNRRLRYREIKTFYSMFNSDQPSQSSSSQNTRHNSDNNNNNGSGSLEAKNDNLHSNVIQQNDNQLAQGQHAAQMMLDPRRTNVTLINLPLLSALTKLAQLEEGSFKQSVAAKIASNLIIDGRDKILITRPANQFLFDGYKVNFMESARDLVSGTLGFNFESPLPKNKFGFFYRKNNTWNPRENGELTVFTGRNDSMNDFMLVDNWNGQKVLNVWPKLDSNNKCNQIKGTDGSQFHPGVTRDQILSIFSPLVCTSLYIKYKEDTQARGIPLLRFTTPPELFAAPRKNPNNACYCTIPGAPISQSGSTGHSKAPSTKAAPNKGGRSINDSRCYLDGLMDLSLCQRGAPVAASSPHFYQSDPMLAMAARLKPEQSKHETYIDIEPMTGAVFRAASRAQLNALVEGAALEQVDSSIIGNMTPMVAPILWLEEAAEINEESAAKFKVQLLDTVNRGRRTFIYAILIGLILALSVSIQYWYVTCYSIDTKKVKKEMASGKVGPGKGRRATTRRQSGSDSRPSSEASRRRQLDENMKLGGGARKSNLAAMEGATVDPASGKETAQGSGEKGNKEQQKRRRQMAPAHSDGYEDDDELSKRMLVSDEWEPAAATNSSGASSSSQHASAALNDDLMRPGTSSAGEL